MPPALPALPALRARARRPVFQDAALAAGLLAVCLPVNNPVAMVRAVAAAPPVGEWAGPAATWSWWTATAFTLVAVTLRRRWPLPMLGVCTLATAAHLTLVVPTIVDLAVVVLLGTVAARCSRPVSSAALAGLLVLVTGWCLFAAHQNHPMNGLPTFSFQVVHRTGSPDGRGAATTSWADSSNTWSAVALLGSMLLAAWAVGSGTRSRRDYLDQLHARAADLERERDQQAALAVAAERGRISRELHDVVAHGLSLIVIQAQGADAALDNRPADTRGALRTIVKTGRDSLADMRRVLAALGEVEDAWHPQPGLSQLPGLIARVRQAGTTVRLRVDGMPTALPSSVDLSAYRIVQEALTNVMKHASAGASADVVICYSDTEVGIDVTDDGRGSTGDVDSDGNGQGNGLRGMDRRVELLGGRLSAGPQPDGGFAVRARLPIEGREA